MGYEVLGYINDALQYTYDVLTGEKNARSIFSHTLLSVNGSTVK